MLKYIAIALLAICGAVFWVSLQHPPMRLMPTPQVFLQDGGNLFAARPAPVDAQIDLFYATNRLPIGPADHRIYTVAPSTDLHLGVGTIRVGEAGMGWDWLYDLSTSADDRERPFLNLDRMREQAVVAGDILSPEAVDWLARVDDAIASVADRDVIVYVHGANTTVERAAGQAAQLMHFTGRNSVVVLFAWPTAENFLRYPRDVQTALGAAPQLARLISLLSQHTRAEAVDVFTYSAGGTVGSEGLALAADMAPRLGEVYHAAPDADFRAFVDDLGRYSDVARRVSVAVNLNDSALRLAQVVNRASRAGRSDLRELTPEASEFLLQASKDGLDVIHVRPENMPNTSTRSHTFWYDDPWVSSDVLLLLMLHLGAEPRGLDSAVGSDGTHYWTFPSDYLERLKNVVKGLQQSL